MSTLDRARQFWALRQAKTTASVQRVAETSDGKVMLNWLSRHVCKMQEPPIEQSGNPLMTGYMIGRQAVMLELLAEIDKPTTELLRQAERLERDQDALEGESEYGATG